MFEKARTIAPTTIAVSAMLKIGQTWKSMKSVTSPRNPGPFTIRSVRFPRAPPRMSPRAIATFRRIGRNDAQTITSDTTIVAPANTHGALRPSPNAPPEFVV